MDQSRVLKMAAKLLAVQEGRGASEQEAAFAAEKLQQLLQDHNLTMSQVESEQGDGAAPVAARVKDSLELRTAKSQEWRQVLLKGIANNNFCLAATSLYSGGKVSIVGRELNVNVTKMTYDYLAEAFVRTAKSQGLTRETKTRRDYVYFMHGAVSRVVERLDERRRQREAEDAERTQTPSGNGSHKELVLSDVYGSEADLNNDHYNRFPPGTTAARRRETVERTQRQTVEHDRLVAEGVDSTVAWYRAYGYSEEDATAQAVRFSRSSRRSGRHSSRAQNWSRRDETEYRKVNSPAYKAGRQTGNDVGLDGQVGAGSTRRIT